MAGSGLSPSDLATASLTAIDSLAPYELGYYARESVSLRQLLVETMNSFCGWIGPDRTGQLRAGRLQDPSASSVLTLTDGDTLDDLVRQLDRAPNLSTSIGATRNWTRHSDTDFAASVTAADKALLKAEYQSVRKAVGVVDRAYAFADNAPVRGTLLQNASDAQAEADRVAMLYRQPRYFYTVTALLDATTALELVPGDTVTLRLPKFDLTNSKNLVVVGITQRFRTQAVKLKLWG